MRHTIGVTPGITFETPQHLLTLYIFGAANGELESFLRLGTSHEAGLPR